MNRIFFLVFPFFSFQFTTLAQPSDSTHARKDSVIRITPIQETGSIEPFGDSTRIISHKEITFTEYRSLYDIISRERGVFVRDLASPGQQNQIVSNGIGDNNIAIMVDGIPYNDYYTGSYNLWNIPVDAIERVEFISGASSMFYDGKSAGGVINIVTKNFNNNRAMTRLRYSQGISGYAHTDAMFAQNIMSGLNLSFGLAHYGFGSDKESQNYRGRFFNSNNDAWNFRTKLRYNITNWFNLSFSYFYDRTWTGLHGGVNYLNTPTIFDGLQAEVQNVESYEKQFNSHYNLTANFFAFEDSSLFASLSFYSFDRLREYRDEENRSVITNGIFQQRDFASIGRGMKLNMLSQVSAIRLMWYVNVERIQSREIIKIGFKGDLFTNLFFTLSPFATIKNTRNKFTTNGGVEGKLRLTSSLILFGGVTQTALEENFVAVDFPLSSTSLFVPLEQREQKTFSLIEIGSRFTLPSLFSSEISYKRTEQKNPFVFDTISFTNSGSYYNPTKYVFEAISTSAHLEWNDFHLEGTANYLKQPAIVRNNVSLTLYPEITMNGSAYYHGLLAKGNLDLKIGVRGNFFSKQTGMRPYDEYGVWISSSDPEFGPSGTMDFFAIGKIGDAYVHFIWENLTGTQYLLAPVYPVYDRNIRFGLSWVFAD